jgi:excisionase family DNA binding protein
MDSLEDNLKRLIKESVREVLRESEFRPPPLQKESPLPKASVVSNKSLLLSSSEAAEKMGVSIQTIRRLIKRGSLKASRVTRNLLIPVSELERLSKV